MAWKYRDYVIRAFNQDKPYDRFVREILAASGEVGVNPAVGWFQQVKDQTAQMEDTAQLFLG